jgi:hypothetical protein
VTTCIAVTIAFAQTSIGGAQAATVKTKTGRLTSIEQRHPPW